MGTPPLWVNDYYVSSPLPAGFGLLLGYSICRSGLSLGYQSRYLLLGGERSSVEAWYSTALDLEESLSGSLDSDVHIFVADGVIL